MTAGSPGQPPGAGVPGGPHAVAASGEASGLAGVAGGGSLAGDARAGDQWREEPWWEPPEREPSDAELHGAWPDPFAGPPDIQTWLLSRDEADAGADERALDDEAVGACFADGGPAEAMVPGHVLAALSEDAVVSGLSGLGDDELVGVLRAARRLASWQAGVELAAVAELDARRRAEAARPGWSRVGEHIAAELAAALTLTGRSADELLGLARGLARIPAVLKALLAGRIDRARAVVFAAELAQLGDLAAAAVAAAFVGLAGSMTTGQLRAALRAMVLAVDPDVARRRAEAGRAQARVERWQEGSGNVGLAGRELPPADAIAADARLTAIAKALQAAGVPGGLDELRAAAYTALLTGRDPDTLLPAPADTGAPPEGCQDGPRAAGHFGEAGGPRGAGWHGSSSGEPGPGQPGSGGSGQAGRGISAAGGPSGAAGGPSGAGSLAGLAGSVHLVMPLSAWLGRADTPGEVAGYGPLDADTCRDLATRLAAGPGTRWCLTLTDLDGRPAAHACARHGPASPRPGPAAAGVGVSGGAAGWLASLRLAWLEAGSCTHTRRAPGYRPPPPLRHLIRIRHRTCAFPGCRRPAAQCDEDHTIAYDDGGSTCECNLATLCRAHHRAKQAPGWQLAQPKPGMLVWTPPHGRSYTSIPQPYPT